MRVADMSEDALISAFAPLLPPTRAVVPSGDDAAVLALTGHTAVSMDLLVEDRHFRREWSSGYDVGVRAARQNLADAVAVGAVPVSLVVGIALPGDLDIEWVVDFARGLAAACEPYGVGVDGGDIVASDSITVAVTVLGDMEGRKATLRSSAQPGQRVVHCGHIGHGIAGLELLRAGYRETDENPNIASLIGRFLRPEPPVDSALAAVRSGALRSLMDVSDGLARDAVRLARASRVWIDLDQRVLETKMGAIAVAAGRLGADRRQWLLAGGEDHGFIGTIAADSDVPEGFTVIGSVVAPDMGGRMTISGREIAADNLGWDHFAG